MVLNLMANHFVCYPNHPICSIGWYTQYHLVVPSLGNEKGTKDIPQIYSKIYPKYQIYKLNTKYQAAAGRAQAQGRAEYICGTCLVYCVSNPHHQDHPIIPHPWGSFVLSERIIQKHGAECQTERNTITYVPTVRCSAASIMNIFEIL